MSKVKINSELFIGAIEQNRIIDNIDLNGYRKKILENSQKFGLIKNDQDNAFANALVTIDGSNPNCIKINEVRAIDKYGQFIYLPATTAIAVPNDANWYWIRGSYTTTNFEPGTISIDTSGNLVGVGTTFLSLLRGQPDFPSVIILGNSVYNTGRRVVLSVTDDTHAQLQGGSFVAETGLTIAVVGTFTPGYIIPGPAANIFVSDYCDLGQDLYNFATPPTAYDGAIFYFARVKNTGGTIVVEDKRNLNIWQTRAEDRIKELSIMTAGTSIFGTEQVMWQSPITDQSRNAAVIGWGFRSTNWSINSNLNILTIIAGNGGRALDTLAIIDDQFNGWRVYTTNGTYRTVIDTVIVGTQINLYLNELNPFDFTASSLVTIVPNAEEIEIIAEAAAFAPYDSYAHNEVKVYPIQDAMAIIPLVVFNSGADQTKYKLTYRLKNNNWYSPIFNDGVTANTYFNELAFDTEGNITDPLEITTGIVNEILLQLNPNALYNIITEINTGDKQGPQNITTWSDLVPVITIQTGVDYNNIVFSGTDFTSTQNLVLNVKSTGAKKGSTFSLDFFQKITVPTPFTLEIRQDYVSPGTPGTLVQLLDSNVLTAGIYKLKLVYSGTAWLVQWKWHVGVFPSIAATLTPDWIPAAPNPDVRYAKDSMGYVSLIGGVTNPVVAAPVTTLFTLPVGFRPSRRIYSSMVFYDGAAWVPGMMTILTTGEVQVVTTVGNITGVNAQIYLDDISFNVQ